MFSKSLSIVLTLASVCLFAAHEPSKVSKEDCLNNPNTPCWCSQGCDWRMKTSSDKPVYIANDKYGKYCYCKQWDYDNYKANCIEGKNIQQPQGAK